MAASLSAWRAANWRRKRVDLGYFDERRKGLGGCDGRDWTGYNRQESSGYERAAAGPSQSLHKAGLSEVSVVRLVFDPWLAIYSNCDPAPLDSGFLFPAYVPANRFARGKVARDTLAAT
jgi:hypothetical protein